MTEQPLTLDALHREVKQVRALQKSELEALRRELEARLTGMDKALTKVEQYPTDLDRAIEREREHTNASIANIKTSLADRDKRIDQRDEATAELLRSQREASNKAIDLAQASSNKMIDGLHMSIRDLKERMDRREGQSEGAAWLWGIILAVSMFAAAVAGVLATLLTVDSPPPQKVVAVEVERAP